MYLSFFGMRQKPFGATPQLGAYYPTQSQEEAAATLRYATTQGRGIGLLTGPTGTGKTMVCHRLANSLEPNATTAMITNTNMSTVKALLQAILYDLALPFHGMDEQELRLSLTDFLLGKFAAGGRTVLIIDEAQNLNAVLLEEIRMLSNLEGEHDKLAQLVLSGQPRLAEQLRRAEFAPLNQRIGARATLTPLNEMETTGYIRCQLRYAGVEPDAIFTPAAYAAVYEATLGVPRVINQLCEHGLILSYAGESRTVSQETIESAWNELVESQGGHVEDQRVIAPAAPPPSRRPEVDTCDVIEPARGTTKRARTPAPASDEPPVVIPIQEPSAPALATRSLAGRVAKLDRIAARKALHPKDESFEEEEEVIDTYSTYEEAQPSKSRPMTPRPVEPAVAEPKRTAKSESAVPPQTQLAPAAPLKVASTPRPANQSTPPSKPLRTAAAPIVADECDDAAEEAVYEVGADVETDTPSPAPHAASAAESAKRMPSPTAESPPGGADCDILVIEDRSGKGGRTTARVDSPTGAFGRGPGVYRRLFTLAKRP